MDIDAAVSAAETASQTPEQSATTTPSVTSLDSLSEFEFQGERLTPERLQEVFNQNRQLSEAQQKYASEERFLSNLDADLEAVIENPALAQKFKSIYPAKYHGIVDRALAKISPQSQSTEKPGLPREFLDEFGRVKQGYEQLQNQLHQIAVESAAAKIDAILPKMYEKYPLAVEDTVLGRAEAFAAQGGKLTEQVWERFVKESHAAVQKKTDAFYKTQLNRQIEKGTQAQDAGPGGATPGKAPKQLKTFADAEKAMIEHLKGMGAQ